MNEPAPHVERLDATEVTGAIPTLADILIDAVDGGSSTSFLPPLDRAVAEEFWARVARDPASHVFVARDAEGIAGVVVLALATYPNSVHRAEVQKLLVHRRARRRGLAAALMRALEAEARALGRTLLVLDTKRGDAAEALYRKLGWTEVGVIPDFAITPEGYCDTVYFYKLL